MYLGIGPCTNLLGHETDGDQYFVSLTLRYLVKRKKNIYNTLSTSKRIHFTKKIATAKAKISSKVRFETRRFFSPRSLVMYELDICNCNRRRVKSK